MNTQSFPPSRRPARPRRTARRAFTLIEVMFASFVMVFGIASAIIVLQSGFKALDTARSTTLASQIMQSEMERIRLLPWDTSTTDSSGNLKPAIIRLPEKEEINPASLFPADAIPSQIGRFTIVRTCEDVADRGGEIKAITIYVTWRGIDGVGRTRSSTTQYSKNGLYDYYYTKAKV